MEQKLLLKPPSVTTKGSLPRVRTPTKSVLKEQTLEDEFAKTVSVSPLPTSPRKTSFSLPRTVSKITPVTQSSFQVRHQLHEVQQIVDRFENEVQLQQQEGLKSSWEVSELQSQFDYLLRITEELAQNNSAEYAQLHYLQETYDTVVKSLNEFERNTLNPLKKILDFRSSLISNGNRFRKVMNSDIAIFHHTGEENHSMIEEIKNMEKNIQGILKHQDEMISYLDWEYSRQHDLIKLLLKESMKEGFVLDEQVQDLYQEKILRHEALEMEKNELYSHAAEFVGSFQEQGRLLSVIDDSFIRFHAAKLLASEREHFARADEESLECEGNLVIQQEEEVSREILKNESLCENLGMYIAEKELNVAENRLIIQGKKTTTQKSEELTVLEEEKLAFSFAQFEKEVKSAVVGTELIQDMVDAYYLLKETVLQGSQQHANDEALKVAAGRELLKKREVRIGEIDSKLQQSVEVLNYAIQQNELRAMLNEEYRSRIFHRSIDGPYPLVQSENEYSSALPHYEEQLSHFETKVLASLHELVHTNNIEEEIKQEEVEIATTIGELKQIEFQDNEANLMFGEDGRELDRETKARYCHELDSISNQYETEKGEMQKLISMLDTDVIALQSAGSRESRAYIPCSDVVRTLLEEIAEMEGEIANIQGNETEDSQELCEAVEEQEDLEGEDDDNLNGENLSFIFQTNYDEVEESIDDWFRQSLND